MDFEIGDNIKLILENNSEIEGYFVPNNDSKIITIKEYSGYNHIINMNKIKEVILLKKSEIKSHKPTEISQNEKLPLIKIINVGGTIASKVNYETGGVSAQLDASELLESIPELTNIARIDTVILSNALSGNIRFDHINEIAKKIINLLEEEIAGIIVSHGTDTMHYTSAGLSFILQNIKVPVVMVGSQRSSDRPSSDSAINLICASKFIVDQTKSKYPKTGIFVSMHENSSDTSCTIFSGLNLRKMHSSKRSAFKQINKYPVAKVNIKSNKIKYFKDLNDDEIEPLFEPVFYKPNIKVGIVKVHPNFYSDQLSIYKTFDGLIIEGTGLGHMPIESLDKNDHENKKIFSSISLLAKKIPVIMTTQCIYGSTNMNIYSYGIKLKKENLIEANATTTETTFMKLAWLLSNFPKEDIEELWKRNFVGEILSRDLYEKSDK